MLVREARGLTIHQDPQTQRSSATLLACTLLFLSSAHSLQVASLRAWRRGMDHYLFPRKIGFNLKASWSHFVPLLPRTRLLVSLHLEPIITHIPLWAESGSCAHCTPLFKKKTDWLTYVVRCCQILLWDRLTASRRFLITTNKQIIHDAHLSLLCLISFFIY